MYEEVKKSFLGSNVALVPERYQSNFVNIGGAFEANYIIWKLLQQGGIKKGKALIVGVFGGRDYYGLLLHGYDTHGLDLANLPEFHKLKIGNVEDRLPYSDEEFDAVVIGEVLEHLLYDVQALENIKRVLKPTGVLIVTVPFLHDIPEYHLRVHTRNSCRRLLEACGLEVLKIVERPAFFRIPFWINWAHHLIGWIFLKTFGFLPHKITLPFWSSVEFKIGQIYNPIRHWSSGFGGYFLCKKALDKKNDYILINKEEFEKNQ